MVNKWLEHVKETFKNLKKDNEDASLKDAMKAAKDTYNNGDIETASEPEHKESGLFGGRRRRRRKRSNRKRRNSRSRRRSLSKRGGRRSHSQKKRSRRRRSNKKSSHKRRH